MKKEKQLDLFFNFTEDLERVPYKSYNKFESVSKIKAFDGVEGTTTLPVWNPYGQMKFDGSEKIESHQDVAYIMRALESKGLEHSFAVHVNDKKEPFIQFLAIGGKAGVMIETDVVLAGAKVHDSKEIYLVHNHPSGNLKPSDADFSVTEQVKSGFSKLDINIHHVIINTYKEGYTLLLDSKDYNTFSRPQIGDTNSYESYMFDGMNVLREPIKTIVSSKSVAELVQQYRFSALPKHGIIGLSVANGAVANFFVDDLDLKTVTDIIANVPTVKNIIAYGNTDKKQEMRVLGRQLKLLGYNLLDYIQVNSEANSVKNAYISYADEGMLRETQEKYGTNDIKDPSVKLKKEFPWEGGEERLSSRKI